MAFSKARVSSSSAKSSGLKELVVDFRDDFRGVSDRSSSESKSIAALSFWWLEELVAFPQDSSSDSESSKILLFLLALFLLLAPFNTFSSSSSSSSFFSSSNSFSADVPEKYLDFVFFFAGEGDDKSTVLALDDSDCGESTFLLVFRAFFWGVSPLIISSMESLASLISSSSLSDSEMGAFFFTARLLRPPPRAGGGTGLLSSISSSSMEF
mmetsp:Transcript_40672/g.73340  ORF Transcript_40672/g.73340 Transcript_40672/m.73340 type:complete len:211 (+) Transcript_40672:2536-3168(+)